jgi:hypothetical protein
MRLAALPVLAALVLLNLGASAAASPAAFELAATLDWRQQVPRPPHPVRAATGTLSGDLDIHVREVHWKLVYRKLSGRATAAEIHLGNLGRRGPLLLGLCGPKVAKARLCKSGLSGSATVLASTVRALEAGDTYVVLHTLRNPAGEIRGQIAIKR